MKNRIDIDPTFQLLIQIGICSKQNIIGYCYRLTKFSTNIESTNTIQWLNH